MKRTFHNMSLQTKLIGFILLTSVVLVSLSLYLLHDAWQESRRAEQVIQINHRANYFFVALKDLAFERGRTNVALAARGPVSPADRDFIDARRKSVDENIRKGLEWLSQNDLRLAAEIQERYVKHQALREKVDLVLGASSGSDRNQLQLNWFEQSTDFIHRIISIFEIVGKRQTVPGRFIHYHRFLIDTLEFRDRIGQNASAMTVAISKNTPLTMEEYRNFLADRAQADYVWTKMETGITVLADEKLKRQKAIVVQEYYDLYRPALDVAVQQALNGNVAPDTAKLLQALSVPALDSVYVLMNQVSEAVNADMQVQKQRASEALGWALIQFTVGLSVVFLTFIYFRTQLFQPLSHIIEALQNIQQGDAVSTLEKEIRRADEIGQLAVGVEMLQVTMTEERRLRKLTELLAVTDELTGLHNRHFLEQNIDMAMEHSDRYEEPLSLVIFDLDHFKRVNDTWGHPAGDAVLKQTAHIAQKTVRCSDLLIRFGGEEFMAVMPHTTAAGAAAAAEKLRKALEDFEHQSAGQVTASFGVAERKKHESFKIWYTRADEALYRAKQCGRNQVVDCSAEERSVALVHIDWLPEWECGDPQIDEQHKKLVGLSNNLVAMSLLPVVEQKKVLLWLDRLFKHLGQHFACEEAILSDIGFPDAAEHATEHKQLLDKTLQIQESYLRDEIKASAFFSFIVDDVIMGHMIQADSCFFPFIKAKNEK